MHFSDIAIIIPAYNESVVLSETLKSVLQLVDQSHIYVVDDGSTDGTSAVIGNLTENVLRLPVSLGKAGALNTGIAFFQLTKKYKYIFPIDADTKVSADFLKNALTILEEDGQEEYICVIGKILTSPHNWLTSYRLWEYEISQRIHKAAQVKENAVIVCSGCATIYRSRLFISTPFPSDTVTEDMDLTFLIHRQKLGKIAFTTKATVTTQDPDNLKDYLKQINRWYTGYWQCLKKHNVPWGAAMLDLELAIAAIEGLSGGILTSFILLFLPLILYKQWTFFAIPLFLDFLIFFLPTIFLTMFLNSNLKMIKYLPHFYFLRAVNSLVFLYTFIKSLLPLKRILSWDRVSRYQIKEGEICTDLLPS
jgi:poly-beta-1,6-N-acetyl-D-glucosamine synthase